eukprot:CAMPEP_0201589768 /NCGR_PEP_ID=MMETSP0190_2-20130828/170552_1 /ASSEMBLY_ACC=CAM_ASM_000263 /TAXON_ID=37353 /ORGANISM="Rosalina sp." /LENGTH=83 /DNA_ID=CAMNT_0048044607 /DNA_START=206 /DNA_END=457 /DNA_ORIENTATION=-
MSIVFWFSKKPEEYADACAYTVSWIMTSVWLWDLWKFHRDSNALVLFHREDGHDDNDATNNEEQEEDIEMDTQSTDNTADVTR